MSLLPRYVSRTVLGAMLLVLLLLLGLEVVFTFIGELEEIKGNYRALDALIYVLLTAPRRAYELIPIAALVGGIVGLGMLASHSELTVMRAAGISIRRLVWWVLKPALVLVLLGIFLGQQIIPKTEQAAELRKAQALGQNYTPGQLWGFWQREGNRFVQIHLVQSDGRLLGVNHFQFDEAGRLSQALYAETASFQGEGWQLQTLRDTRLAADGSAKSSQTPAAHWRTDLTPDFLALATVDPEYLSLSDLYRFAHHLKEQGLDAGQYFLEFWKKLLAPLATISMVLIACSFIFGPLRSVTMGLRIVTGVMAGLLFRYAQDFFGYASLVYDFSPMLAAGLPIALCLLIGGVAIARVR